MARNLRYGVGPEINDIQGFRDDAVAGWSIVSVPAPAQGAYFFRATGVDAAALEFQGSADSLAFTYRWIVLREFRLDGTLNAGQEVSFLRWDTTAAGVAHRLHWVRVSASTYNLRLKRNGAVLGTGSTAFSTGASVAIRVQTDGAHVQVWANGALEIDALTTESMVLTVFYLKNVLAAGQDMYFGGLAVYEAANESDRPGTVVSRYGLFPNAEAVGQYGGLISGGVEDCADTAKGRFQNWDDWLAGGVNDGNTEYNCNYGTPALKEISELSTAVVANVANAGVICRGFVRANIAAKNIITFHRIEDAAGNSLERQNAVLTDTTYHVRAAALNRPPDGLAWTQAKVDALRGGVRTPGMNLAGDLWTAWGIELFTVDDDPPLPGGFSMRNYWPLG